MRVPGIILIVVYGLVPATAAQAKPEYFDVLLSTYKPYAQALSSRSCANCHVSDSDYKMNPYGKQVAQELLNAGTKTLTPELLHNVESLASNPGDISNLEKFKQGLAPGEPRSGATGAKSPATSGATIHASGHTAAPEQKPLIPKNAYHPAIVHFPIALFIAGLMLDLVGMLRKDRKFLIAGWYNLVIAAVSSFAAIATGLTAMFVMRLPFKGLILNHLLLAIAGTMIMWILVALRVHRHETMSKPLRILYYVVAAAGLILISYSAHLGGKFVYGE
jgi:uncharacterized membrane protein